MASGSSFSSRSAISINRPSRSPVMRLVLMVGLIPFCSQMSITAIANQSYQTYPPRTTLADLCPNLSLNAGRGSGQGAALC
jgi:hypothetical protein